MRQEMRLGRLLLDRLDGGPKLIRLRLAARGFVEAGESFEAVDDLWGYPARTPSPGLLARA